ncbi:hypothetical protein H9Q70_012132 [Fusarium xylarioides]|nr:hypothetical protein H9Q70_012132 [Fusarium xylarioides]
MPLPPNIKQSHFLVGWVCILQEEYSAALHVLDESYDTDHEAGFISGMGDSNTYELGRIALDFQDRERYEEYISSYAVCAAELLKCLALSSVRKMKIEMAPDEITDLIYGAVDAAEGKINQSLNSLGGDLDDLKAAHDNIKERIELLNNFTDQQKQFAEDEMKVIRVTCQKLLDKTIHDLKEQAEIEAAKADYVTRLEWEEFTKQIETTAEKSSKLATAEELLDTAGELTDNIIQDAKGKGDGSYAKYFKFGSRFTKLAMNFRGAGNKTNNTGTNSVAISPSYIPPTPSPSSQSGHKDSTSSSGGRSSQRLACDTTGTSQSSFDRSGLATPTRPAPPVPRIEYEKPSIPPRSQRTSLSRDRPPNGSSPSPSDQLAVIMNVALQERRSREEPKSASPLHQDSPTRKAPGLSKRF